MAGVDAENFLHLHLELLQILERHKRLHRAEITRAVNAARTLSVKNPLGDIESDAERLMTDIGRRVDVL